MAGRWKCQRQLCGLLELFEKRKVALISVAGSLDTGSAAGRLVITIMGAVSQWEREAIGKRTRDALKHKRTSGERVGNIRFGFRLSTHGKHVEPDPGEQAVLTEIRHLRQHGHRLRGIAAALNQKALRTRRGSAWRLEHVARIVKQTASVTSLSHRTAPNRSAGGTRRAGHCAPALYLLR